MNHKPQLFLLVVILFITGIAWGQGRAFGSPADYLVQVTKSPKASGTAPEVRWKFSVSMTTDKNGAEVPETYISVLINDVIIPVGRYTGHPKTVTGLKKAGMPSNAIMACKSWFGGAGDDLYLAKEDDTTMVLYHRHVDENDEVLPPFRKIKTIKVPTKASAAVPANPQ